MAALADDPAPPGAFVRGAYRRLRVGPCRVLYEVEGDLITIVPGRSAVWAWSNWRRRHQHRARPSHYQQRQAIYNEILL